jgi:hypothetical protein
VWSRYTRTFFLNVRAPRTRSERTQTDCGSSSSPLLSGDGKTPGTYFLTHKDKVPHVDLASGHMLFHLRPIGTRLSTFCAIDDIAFSENPRPRAPKCEAQINQMNIEYRCRAEMPPTGKLLMPGCARTEYPSRFILLDRRLIRGFHGVKRGSHGFCHINIGSRGSRLNISICTPIFYSRQYGAPADLL